MRTATLTHWSIMLHVFFLLDESLHCALSPCSSLSCWDNSMCKRMQKTKIVSFLSCPAGTGLYSVSFSPSLVMVQMPFSSYSIHMNPQSCELWLRLRNTHSFNPIRLPAPIIATCSTMAVVQSVADIWHGKESRRDSVDTGIDATISICEINVICNAITIHDAITIQVECWWCWCCPSSKVPESVTTFFDAVAACSGHEELPHRKVFMSLPTCPH